VQGASRRRISLPGRLPRPDAGGPTKIRAPRLPQDSKDGQRSANRLKRIGRARNTGARGRGSSSAPRREDKEASRELKPTPGLLPCQLWRKCPRRREKEAPHFRAPRADPSFRTPEPWSIRHPATLRRTPDPFSKLIIDDPVGGTRSQTSWLGDGLRRKDEGPESSSTQGERRAGLRLLQGSSGG